MTGIVQDVFPGGEKVLVRTSITLVNNTALTIDVEVPAGEKWLLLFAKMANFDNVTRVCSISQFEEAAKTNLIKGVTVRTLAAAGRMQFPGHPSAIADLSQTYQFLGWYMLILDAGEVLQFAWGAGGASAGIVDADGLIIEYMRRIYA